MEDVDMEHAVMLSTERELIHMHTEWKKFNNNVTYNSKILQEFQRSDLDLSGLVKWTYNKANVIETKAKRIWDLRKVKMNNEARHTGIVQNLQDGSRMNRINPKFYRIERKN
jgi:hypothetical protein